MSPKQEDILETTSTCRFAQRVALIKNEIQKNEAVDPAVIIARLKRENAQLKAEIALLKGGQDKDELDKYEIEDCHKAVNQYLDDEDPAASLMMSDRLKINECFYYIKNILKKGGKINFNKSGVENNNSSNTEMAKGGKGMSGDEQNRFQDEIKKLKLAVQSRDNEITLLLSLINKKKGNNQPLIPVKRGTAEEEEMMKSVIKARPMEFATEADLNAQMKMDEKGDNGRKQNNWMSDNGESRISNIDNVSTASKKSINPS